MIYFKILPFLSLPPAAGGDLEGAKTAASSSPSLAAHSPV